MSQRTKAHKNEVVFRSGNWAIELRRRNNSHNGYPNRKVWIIYNGQEAYSLDERGLRPRSVCPTIPEKVRHKAQSCWEELVIRNKTLKD